MTFKSEKLMKKIILIALFLYSLQNFAQKTFEVYNFSGQTIKLADIITKPTASTYPEYHSKPALITIPPGGSFTLENTSNVYRFPFYVTGNPIATWQRLNSPSSTTFVPSTAAWTLGISQVFSNLKFFDGLNILREVGVSNPAPATFSSGITAEYSQDNPAPNVWYYTIVIY